MSNYLLHLLIMMGIYAILAYSMNLVIGYGGLVTFGHAIFYGAGAYAYALLRLKAATPSQVDGLLFVQQWPFLPALGGGGLAGALCAWGAGWFSLRFRGDFFVFATLGFQMIAFVVFQNATQLTGGAAGLSGIPRPELFGWKLRELWAYALLVLTCVSLLLLPLLALLRSPFGLSLQALREDERAAESLGVNSLRQHLSAFTLAGAYAGIAGGLFASYVTYIDATSFSIRESIFLVTMLLLGGSGNARGPAAGVLIMLLLPEFLRFLGIPSGAAPHLREVLYGAMLIALMYFRPRGLAGRHQIQ